MRYKVDPKLLGGLVVEMDGIRYDGSLSHRLKEIKDVKADFDKTFKDCKKLNNNDIKIGVLKNIWQAVLRLFAPLF